MIYLFHFGFRSAFVLFFMFFFFIRWVLFEGNDGIYDASKLPIHMTHKTQQMPSTARAAIQFGIGTGIHIHWLRSMQFKKNQPE